MVEGDLCRVECHDSPSVEQQSVNLKRSPVIRPGIHIHRERVALVEVDLPTAAHLRVPELTGPPEWAPVSAHHGCRRDSEEVPACHKAHFLRPRPEISCDLTCARVIVYGSLSFKPRRGGLQ